MPSTHQIIDWTEKNRDIAFDFVRIYLGIGLLVRGWFFILDSSEVVNLLSQSGEPTFLSAALVHYVALAHFGGGLLMAIGLLTRISALVQIPVLIGAVFFVHLNEGLLASGQSLEFSALVLFLLIVIFFHGSGRLSLDHYLFERSEESENRARQLSLFDPNRNGRETSVAVNAPASTGADDGGRIAAVAPDRPPKRSSGTNKCTCTPQRDRNDPKVRAERIYGMRALRFVTGTTGTPKEIVFRCRVCQNVVERSSDEKDIAFYTYR